MLQISNCNFTSLDINPVPQAPKAYFQGDPTCTAPQPTLTASPASSAGLTSGFPAPEPGGRNQPCWTQELSHLEKRCRKMTGARVKMLTGPRAPAALRAPAAPTALRAGGEAEGLRPSRPQRGLLPARRPGPTGASPAGLALGTAHRRCRRCRLGRARAGPGSLRQRQRDRAGPAARAGPRARRAPPPLAGHPGPPAAPAAIGGAPEALPNEEQVPAGLLPGRGARP